MRIPIPLEKHDVLAQMGRFTLRDEGKTIALGKVLKYKPAKLNTMMAMGDVSVLPSNQTTEG